MSKEKIRRRPLKITDAPLVAPGDITEQYDKFVELLTEEVPGLSDPNAQVIFDQGRSEYHKPPKRSKRGPRQPET